MTDVLVGAETLLLVLVSLFLVALLRSHAEILRRLELIDGTSALPQPREARGAVRPAPDLLGTTPDGGARRISLRPGGPDTLLAFLSTGCSTCGRLLDALESSSPPLPPATRLVVVTKDREVERVRRLRAASGAVEVVMSSAAWTDYGAPGSPFFVHVDGATGTVAGEGSAGTWEQVADLLTDALDDHRDAVAAPRIDATLEAAGIGPGHASLHPAPKAAGG